jgi:hypothetical protein
MKIATIVFNSLHILSVSLILIFQLLGWAPPGGYISAGTGITLSAIAIAAAMKYAYVVLYATTIGLFGMAFFYIITVKVFCFILVCLLLCAQCYFVYEIRMGIMTQERYDAGTEEFISEEGIVVVETTQRIATEVVESSSVALASTRQAVGTIQQQSARVLNKYVSPALGMRDDESDSSDSSFVIVESHARVRG